MQAPYEACTCEAFQQLEGDGAIAVYPTLQNCCAHTQSFKYSIKKFHILNEVFDKRLECSSVMLYSEYTLT